MKIHKKKIKLSREEYDKIVLSPYANHVFVKIVLDNHDVVKDGIHMYGDSDGSIALQYYAQRYGIIDKLPSDINYNANNKKDVVMKWKTSIEVEVGDEIWFKINAVIYDVYEVEGIDYILMHYRELILARRGKEIICLNGNILYQKVFEKPTDVVDYRDEVEVEQTGIVTHIGKPNLVYVNNKSTEREGVKINIGDKFISILANHAALEDLSFAHFDKEERYYFIQRRFIDFVH